jgi:hypothetical protein
MESHMNQPDEITLVTRSTRYAKAALSDVVNSRDRVNSTRDEVWGIGAKDHAMRVKRRASAEACCAASLSVRRACEALVSTCFEAENAADRATTPEAKLIAMEAVRSASSAVDCVEEAVFMLRDICSEAGDYAGMAFREYTATLTD